MSLSRLFKQCWFCDQPAVTEPELPTVFGPSGRVRRALCQRHAALLGINVDEAQR